MDLDMRVKCLQTRQSRLPVPARLSAPCFVVVSNKGILVTPTPKYNLHLIVIGSEFWGLGLPKLFY